MINEIKNTKDLSKYIHNSIEDQGIVVEIDSSLTEELYGIIKVDDYYNGFCDARTPKSTDFIVAVDCECGWYVLYILELKNVNSPYRLNVRDIQDKFSTVIDDFLKKRFSSIFLKDNYKYKDIKLYLVSDAYGVNGKFSNHEEYKKVMKKANNRDSLKVDFALSSKLYKFRNKILKIEYDIPPNPIIEKIT